MPWKEIGVMDEKLAFVFRVLSKDASVTELCNEYGIAPKTGYKWLERFKEKGRKGLEELSRKPSTCPFKLSAEVVLDIVSLKQHHLAWGARKILQLYRKGHPSDPVPALSTVTRIFQRAGLVKQRKRRRATPGNRIQRRIIPQNPNDVWTVDFKGWWYTQSKEQVNPLTVRDEFSKEILAITILDKADISCVKKEFHRVFSLYGLPKCIRSDNGPPFASQFNALGLTKLSAWWMSLGIQLDRIDPGCPYQNGAHERMHRDMASELEGHIFGNLREHQKAFDIWRTEYNTVRPHDALGMKCPAEFYRKSDKVYEPQIEDIAYPPDLLERRVNTRGVFHYLKHRYFIGNPFDGYTVGIKIEKVGKPEIWFSDFLIGHIDVPSGLVEFKSGKMIARAS